MGREKGPGPAKNISAEASEKSRLQKEVIVQRLKEQGCRITHQRLMLLDIILEGQCSCCKEIYYQALRRDSRIGKATVYRLVNTLEEMGSISRRNLYRVDEDGIRERYIACTVELTDHTVYHLTQEKWESVLREGLRACGYLQGQDIRKVRVSTS